MTRLLLAAFLGWALIVPAVRADDDEPAEKSETPKVAHIELSGPFDETPAGDDPLFSALTESFKSALDRIAKAKDDPKVKALALEIDDLSAGLFGYGKIGELRQALADFRASGKKAFAYMESGSEPELLLGLACDVLVMPESGDVNLTGLRLEMVFLKEMLDKIGVEADFLRMGDYKSAAEQFTRTSMSEENREQYTAILNDLFENSLVAPIAESRPDRNWTADEVKRMIDGGPYTATRAHKLGLIDRLAYSGDFKKLIAKELDLEEVDLVKDYGKADKEDIDFSNPFAIFKLFGPQKKRKSDAPKVAVIFGVGAIQTGKGGAGLFSDAVMGSDTMVKAIREAEADDTVKAIVLRVDSPGGSALASDLIWRALKDSKKPVVASMGDVAGSGGYYVCMSAKKIFAEPATLTGSIGVVGGKFVTKGLFDWAGIHTESISRGKNAGLYTSERPFRDSEREAVRELMEEVYDQFLDKALEGRQRAGVEMTRDQLKKLAGGRVYTGRQAKELGLVDELGTLEDAIAEAKKLADLDPDEKTELLILPKPVSFLDRLMEGGLGASQSTQLGPVGSLLREFPQLRRPAGLAMSMLQSNRERVWLVMPASMRVR